MGCFQSKPAGKPLPPDANAALPADDSADPGKHAKPAAIAAAFY
jgi:hypothetical protein